MKRFLISITIFFSFQLHAQTLPADSALHCSYYGEATAKSIRLFPATSEAKKAIQQILDVVGLRPNFEINAANVDNAAAIIYNGRRYILYNTKFMTDINTAAHTNWAGISIL